MSKHVVVPQHCSRPTDAREHSTPTETVSLPALEFTFAAGVSITSPSKLNVL